jgi:hypothetical protein
MEFGNFISDLNTVWWVLEYYLVFWLLNTIAYGLITFGVWRWMRFTHGLNINTILRTTFRITGTFGTIRLVIGILGLLLLASGTFTPFETILTLGISSLCLNTTFILLEGIFVNREAKLLMDTPEQEKVLMRQAISQFESLRRTVKNA